jgi:hypothetical protein
MTRNQRKLAQGLLSAALLLCAAGAVCLGHPGAAIVLAFAAGRCVP